MSKNRNRAKLNKAENNSNYRKIWINSEYPIYYDEGWNTHRPKGMFKWKRKQLYPHQVRKYKTWKHNRETQWK